MPFVGQPFYKNSLSSTILYDTILYYTMGQKFIPCLGESMALSKIMQLYYPKPEGSVQ